MSVQLWLLRHGEAEPHGVRPDADRALTEKGRAQSLAAGRALAHLGIEFAAIYTSPRKRALDTAVLAVEALDGRPQIHQPLHAGFSRADAEELLVGAAPDARVLLVGHEPDFSQVIHDFTGARVDFKKGGVAMIRFPQAELVLMLRPREIELLAGVG
jgi:phosphohistidine phosphatase